MCILTLVTMETEQQINFWGGGVSGTNKCWGGGRCDKIYFLNPFRGPKTCAYFKIVIYSC